MRSYPWVRKPVLLLLTASIVHFFAFVSVCRSGESSKSDEAFFVLDNGINLREFAGPRVGRLLVRVRGEGKHFGAAQQRRYCHLKKGEPQIQWTLIDLETGEIISKSSNANKKFFGASASKVFVAAALLNKQAGHLTKRQLRLMIKMITKSDNSAWIKLQREVGDDGTDDSGRQGVDAFVREMGYANLRGFQGWLKKKDGSRIHGNELNTLALAKFLYDTYHQNYMGAEVLWKIMHATTTGRKKINKYIPKSIYIGGKTGTYDGPNACPKTVKLPCIRARNHVAVLKISNRYYGLSILCNTGCNEDVAVLAGGLVREFLGVEKPVKCKDG